MRWTAGAAVLLLMAAGCSSDADNTKTSAPPPTSRTTSAGSSTATSSSGKSTAPSSSTSKSGSKAEQVLAGMSLRERAGQLIMIDCPSTGAGPDTRAAITQYEVGSVILDGTTTAGVDGVGRVTREIRGLAPKNVGLFIAGDQEGGIVQRLQGSGFDRIPSAVQQGNQAPSQLQANAKVWGQQLAKAGLNVNLAPVLDVVPPGGGSNPPIGDLNRQYGSTPDAVTSHGLAFAKGMAAAGVDSTVKHFPGLGRVSGNTDVATGVTDTVTTRDDANLAPFRAAVKAGVPFVMMSTAIYQRIDPGTPAAFSKPIVTGLLRKSLGFSGVVVTDDVGGADQVGGYSVGERATRFISAGGDLVLTVVAAQAQPMTSAIIAKAKSDPAFRKLVDAAALRVLKAKQARGLL